MKLLECHDISNSLLIKCKESMPSDENNVAEYIREFQDCLNSVSTHLDKNNITTVKVFIKAPVELSAYIMPYFINKRTVIMHHWTNDKYVELGPVDTRHIKS